MYIHTVYIILLLFFKNKYAFFFKAEYVFRKWNSSKTDLGFIISTFQIIYYNNLLYDDPTDSR